MHDAGKEGSEWRQLVALVPTEGERGGGGGRGAGRVGKRTPALPGASPGESWACDAKGWLVSLRDHPTYLFFGFQFIYFHRVIRNDLRILLQGFCLLLLLLHILLHSHQGRVRFWFLQVGRRRREAERSQLEHGAREMLL